LYAVDRSEVERSQFFAIGNAINFRYWDKVGGQVVRAKGVKRGQEFAGAMYMWRCLQVALDDGRYPLLSASYLANLTVSDFAAIFSDDHGQNPLQIGEDERLTNLRDLGQRLVAKWNGQFFELVKTAQGSLVSFAQLSQDFRAYDDSCYKLTMVNAILHSGSGLVSWDADPLPGIDYQLLKQLLRIGVMTPATRITAKLQRQELLSSDEAYELRRTALRAFATMSTMTGLSGELLDNRFFMNRRKCDDERPVCLDPRTASECPFYGPCEERIAFTIPLEMTRYY
jgi:hypothetical protein